MVVIPILFFDFLAGICLAGSVVQVMIADKFGASSYMLMGLTGTCKGVLSFLTSPALGSLSDHIGRKHLFVLTVLGTSAPTSALALGATLEVYLVLVGLSGLLSATFPLAFAYIADHVPPRGRASAFGQAIGMGLGGAFLVGPPLGAWLNEHFGSMLVFQSCLALTIANVAFALYAMRDSVRPAVAGTEELLRRANPCASFAMLKTNQAMRLLAAIVLLFYLALWGFLANKGVYARRRFGQSVAQTAAQLSLFGLVSTISQSVGLHLARRSLSEPTIARVCFFCAVLSQIIYAFADEQWMLYPAMALLGISLGGFATVSSLCSQVVSHELVGEAQGVLASMKALMEGVGPVGFAWMLPRAEETSLPGAPWLVSSVLMAAAFGLCFQLESYMGSIIPAAECMEAAASDPDPDPEASTCLEHDALLCCTRQVASGLAAKCSAYGSRNGLVREISPAPMEDLDVR
jgi:DHA1 family tetracycline resistance protein-like MFS transporter